MSQNDVFSVMQLVDDLSDEVDRLNKIIRDAGGVLDRQGLDHPHIALTILMEEALKE